MTAAGSPESRSLGVRDAELMSVSGTGELAMLRSDGVLAVSPLTGARSPRDMAANVFDADWSPNGELAAIRRWDPRQGLTPLEFPLGHPIGGSALKTSAQRIRVARDGKRVVISEQPLIAETSRLRLVDVSGDVRDLGTWSSMTGFSFSPDGREIWLSGARAGSGPVLWAVGLTGNARVLARFPGEPVLMDVASDGRALIAIVERRTHMTAVVDGQERDLSWLGASGVRGITDDGRTIVFEDVGDAPGAARSVWIRTIDGAQATRLGEGRPLDIAPQGQWVAATNTGPPAKLVIYPTGPGTPRVLVEGAQDYPGATFLQNGRGLLVVETPMPDQRSPLPFAFKLFDLTSGAVTAIGSDAGPIHVRHAVAPDGRSLIVKRQGGAFFVVPLDGSAWKWDTLQPIPGLSEQDFVKEWTEEGVYTQQFDPRALRIDRVQIPSGARSTWKTLAPADASGVERPGAGGFFAMTPDARTYVYSFSRALSTLYLVDGLK